MEGSTELLVDLDVLPDQYDYFKDEFPKALDMVKELAEKGTEEN